MKVCYWLMLIYATILVIKPSLPAKTSGPTRSTVDKVIIHTTGGPTCKNNIVVFTPSGTVSGMKDYFEKHPTLGIHYIVGKKGEIEASIPEEQIANHALGNNQKSIGIELINKGDGKDPFPSQQIDALVHLLKGIKARWSLDASNILRHSALDSRTFNCGGKKIKLKQDPGLAFPMKEIIKRVK